MESHTNHQRVGATSNAHAGRDFEQIAARYLSSQDLTLEFNHTVEVGVGKSKKFHQFDLGSDESRVLVECKSHTWTSGNNVPSAKLTVWNEAMYYFHCSPADYRKIFFVLRDVKSSSGESLAEYYLRLYAHLVPDDVEIWEYDQEVEGCIVVKNNETSL